MASCRRVRLGKWRLLMIACLVLVIFLTESYSLALSKRLSIPLMSASGGHGVAFLPELGGSLPRAALRSFLNLLSRLGRDCPPIVRTKAPHAPIPHLLRLVGSIQEHQLNFHGWHRGPRSTNPFEFIGAIFCEDACISNGCLASSMPSRALEVEWMRCLSRFVLVHLEQHIPSLGRSCGSPLSLQMGLEELIC
jgi:hypothetical protein